MKLTSLHLLMFYAGFGFVAFLAWAATVDYLRDGGRHERLALHLFTAAGIVHPVAALAAWQLRHETSEGEDRRGIALVVVSCVLAVPAVMLTT
jgi:hypothetical protein